MAGSWPRVGGIVAARQNNVGPTGPIPNITAFDNRLTSLYSSAWHRDYRFVEPWDDTYIASEVNALLGYADLKVLVVTGTTLGEKVKAVRDASTVTPKPWIVMTTDDGSWTCTFAANWNAEGVTGMSSGYNRVITVGGNLRMVTGHRARKLRALFVPAHAIRPAILRAKDSLLSAAAVVEKQQQADAVRVALGLSSPAPEFYVDQPATPGGPFRVDAPPGGGENALIVLGDAVTFLARHEIANMLATDPAWSGFIRSSGPHSAFKHAGLTMSYGPNMPKRYERAADFVDLILRGLSPGGPHCNMLPVDFEDA
jgi:hypothetical protein